MIRTPGDIEKAVEEIIQAHKDNGNVYEWQRDPKYPPSEQSIIVTKLLKEGLAERFATKTELTPKGISFTTYENARIKEKQKQEDEEVKNFYDAGVKKWLYKTRSLPIIFSALALIGTGISIYISITALNYKKDRSEILLMQQEIQQLKIRANTQDSLYRSDTLLRKHN